MKEEWKVWIKGVPNRGNEVIKALTDLGAKEPFFTTSGSNDNFIHFINHKGEIAYEWLDSEQGQIIMDNYKEIKLPEEQFGKWDWKPEWKWKPEEGDPYWMINCNGYVDSCNFQ